MVRDLACWPITYQRDVATQEHRNIGVLINEAGHTELRLMGYRSTGLVEPAYFCKAFNFSEGAGWVYREWVRWFHVLASEVVEETELIAEFDRLKRSGSNFGTGECIRVMAPLEEPTADVAEMMFQHLVVVPKLTPKSRRFSEQVEHLVLCSEIEYRAPFHRSVELEIQHPDQTIHVQLAYFVEAPKPLGIKVLRFQGRSTSEVATQINDIRHTFETLIANEILERSRCVVIHDNPRAGTREQLHRIKDRFTFLAVNDPIGPDYLRTMVP